MTEYTVDYFIKKFSKIPRNKWTKYVYIDSKSRCCALGHCGNRDSTIITKEAGELIRLFWLTFPYNVPDTNDGSIGVNIKGKHPRTRILNALKQIKKAGARCMNS